MNNELQLNVDKQQDDINRLKEQCDIDNEDETQEIQTAISPKKKKKTVFVTCIQTFVTKNGLKNVSMKSRLSSGEIIVAKSSEIERK